MPSLSTSIARAWRNRPKYRRFGDMPNAVLISLQLASWAVAAGAEVLLFASLAPFLEIVAMGGLASAAVVFVGVQLLMVITGYWFYGTISKSCFRVLKNRLFEAVG